uniref:Uncharacterized protein n=1 Tax=Manihot esculenta TaxID=3983 RepID=A0A251J9U9_MANES
MASGEGFLTDEQREMLKIASLNVDNLSSPPKSLSSSPKSPSMLLSEHHIKAPTAGKATNAGMAVRHVRRSHSGKLVRVKKGEYVWILFRFELFLCFDSMNLVFCAVLWFYALLVQHSKFIARVNWMKSILVKNSTFHKQQDTSSNTVEGLYRM